jgi:phospholipid/cholesterol/gamma-HCH transport system ATP-binding protein
MDKPPVIELREVSLTFEETQVLSRISFRVDQGETLFLLGVTGSGKSVLLKLILGLINPDSGQVLVHGRDLTGLPEEEIDQIRRRMGIVFQEGALFDSLSVYENVAYRLREEGLRQEAEIERRVREVLRFVEMEEAIDKMPSELSGGMRRRVAIARAIISQPEIMLYDSPTAGLDPVTSHTITMQIAKLRDVQHVTSLVVTHRLQDAFVLTNYFYLEEKTALVPLRSLNHAGPPPVTRFLLLRDAGAYFQGTAQELAATQDDYLLQFLA